MMASNNSWRLLSAVAVAGLAVTTTRPARAEKNPLPPYVHHHSFEKIAVKRGVTVYKHRNSDIIRIGAEARFPVSPMQVQTALIDYGRQVGRIARLSEARVLRRGEGWLEVYQHLNLPVISDRDFVLRVRHGAQGDTRWVSYSAVTNRGPAPRSGIVRVSLHRGSWKLEPVDDGRATHVTFQTAIDLSGWLPMWMARAGAGKELPDLFAAICQLAAPAQSRSGCP